MNVLRAYLDVQKQTASKERLMVMLFDAALRHIRAGAAALQAGQNASAGVALGKASDIVEYLMVTLEPRHEPDLCQSLADVYTFVMARLVTARGNNDPVAAREAERVFVPIAAAFAQVVAKLEPASAAVAR